MNKKEHNTYGLGRALGNMKQNIRSYTMIIALVVIWGILALLTKGTSLSPRNLSILFRQTAVTGILALGMLLVIVTGNIDMSVGSAMGLLGGIAACCQVWYEMGLPATIGVVLVFGLLVGAWNGFWVAYMRVPGRRYAPEPIIENMEEPEEITSEYSNFGYDTDDAKEKEIDEIINSAKAYKSELEREAYKNNYGYEENSTEDEKKKEPTAADTSETEPEKIDENEKDNAETPEKHEDISSSSGPTLVIPDPEHDLFETSEPDDIDREDDADVEETEEVSEQKHPLEKKVDKYANIIFGSDDPEEKTGEEVDDEELVRAKAKKNKFDSGYDFFDEAPKKSMGVIKSSDLRDAEDFDVIGEVERKAETVKQNALEKENNKETEGEPNDKRSTEEVLANVGKNIGNALRGFAGGVKNFGIHCGYFCKNVSIMIKRKRAIAKRKKAEEERRERERQKAERARMRAERGESDGLVQVHSRTDRRPQQNRHPVNRNKRR